MDKNEACTYFKRFVSATIIKVNEKTQQSHKIDLAYLSAKRTRISKCSL